MDDEHRRRGEPVRAQPSVALRLRSRAARFGTACEKDHFPAALLDEPEQARERARLDLVERLPEVFPRAHGVPELALPSRAQRPSRDFGFPSRLLAAVLGRVRSSRRHGSRQALRIDIWKQSSSLAGQCALQVGHGAVEIEPYSHRGANAKKLSLLLSARSRGSSAIYGLS